MASISITAANVICSANGQKQDYVVGAGLTVTQGMALYFDSTTQTVLKADCDAGSPGDAIRGTNGVLLALTAGSPGQPVVCLSQDLGNQTTLASALTIGASLADGDRIYLSPTAGELTVTIGDLATGDSVITCGFVYTDGTVRWNPQPGGVLP